jgi:hypothetical protein
MHRGSRVIAPPILNLGARWRLVFNIRYRPLHSRVITPVSTEQEAVWTQEPFRAFRKTEKYIAFARV